MQVIGTIAALRHHVAALRDKGKHIALVPTMGALHAGHKALIRAALADAPDTHVIVSIFVNPTQFAPNEDFGSYPRRFEQDAESVRDAGGHAIWAPGTAEMYPDGFATTISLAGPATVGLEDRFRPTHFAGVATVVAKLFLQVKPDVATFGEKDYQQLKVVTRMASDLDLETRILPVPTLREADGLALSSRNAYLSEAERLMAPMLQRNLVRAADEIRQGCAPGKAAEASLAAIASAGFVPDYLEARHDETLAPIARIEDGPIRLLVAARLGKTRLIDNVAV